MLKKQYSEFCQDKVILACFGKSIFSNYKLCFKKNLLILGNILVRVFAFVGFSMKRDFLVQRDELFVIGFDFQEAVLSIVYKFYVLSDILPVQ